MAFLAAMLVACLGSLPWTLALVSAPGDHPGNVAATGSPRYDRQVRTARQLPPSWWGIREETASLHATGEDTEALRLEQTARRLALEQMALSSGPTVTVEQVEKEGREPTPEQVRAATPYYIMGTDLLGRDLLVRCLAGGGVSLVIGIAAAMISVMLGTAYGAAAGYAGGRIDAVMMRIVDILYGLPYILLVVLLAVAADAAVDNWQARRVAAVSTARQQLVDSRLAALPSDRRTEEARRAAAFQAVSELGTGELSTGTRKAIEIVTLLVAIGGVSWLTMARVVRGQVLSLKSQPFMEAARAMGVPLRGQFFRHLLPNLIGPITVYATLTVPQAMLQESFLSFLGIGVRPPMPSWGNLVADGLVEINPYKSHWWLLLFPCLLLGTTLLAMNFVGEGLREALDPRRARQ